MARIGYLNLDPALKKSFGKSVKQGERFVYSKLVKNKTLCSRKKRERLRSITPLKIIQNLWNGLSSEDKEAWQLAGAEIGMNGYNLFVQDTSYRLKNEIEGLSTPSILHQYFVGKISISAPATNIKIKQSHPRNYWLFSLVPGKKTMQKQIEITEELSLPLTISLNYCSNLSAVGSWPSISFFAEVWHAFEGQNLIEVLELNLDLVSDWKNAEATLEEVSGTLVGYNLYIEAKDLQGELFFDNIKAIHSGQNWAIDSACNDINNALSDKFFNISKNWEDVDVPEGSSYNSIYLN